VNVRAAVKNVFGHPLARTLVNAQGAGVNAAARTNSQGVAILPLAPTRAGPIQFRVAARTLTAAGAKNCRTLLAVRGAAGGGSKPAPSPGKPAPSPGKPAPSPGKPHFTG
jgi:hypothetical protein